MMLRVYLVAAALLAEAASSPNDRAHRQRRALRLLQREGGLLSQAQRGELLLNLTLVVVLIVCSISNAFIIVLADLVDHGP